MAEAVAAAATLISIIGFAAQVFDGCVKGFVLLSSAHNLGRDADMLRSMLDWEQFRLEQWAEKVGLQDPAKADMLVDWKLITDTLKHIENLLNDTDVLKKKYGLEILEKPLRSDELASHDQELEKEDESKSRFKRLFTSSDLHASNAAAKVLLAKNKPMKRLWWAAVDKDKLKSLISDLSHFIQRLHDSLNSAIQEQMHQSMKILLQNAANRYSSVPDLDFLRQVASDLRSNDKNPSNIADADALDDEIRSKLTYELFHSIQKGELDQVVSFLDKGLDVQTENRVGWPTLLVASEYGHLPIVDLLLQRGADPSKGTIGNRLPFHFAAENGHLPVLDRLLQHPSTSLNFSDTNGQTALHKATIANRPAIVAHLLDQPTININCLTNDGFMPLHLALFDSATPILHLLLARQDLDINTPDTTNQQTPLWMAVHSPPEILSLLLSRPGLNLNAPSRYGEPPLCRSVRQKVHPSTRLLVDAGANVNVTDGAGNTPLSLAASFDNETDMSLLLAHSTIDINIPNHKGLTPLILAASKNHLKSLRLLLAHNPPPTLETKSSPENHTALAAAAAAGHKIACKILLKAGADINIQDKTGNTPLALAARGQHDATVRFLLESGADADIADEDEETPFDKARDGHVDEIVKVFKEVLKI